jgi:hypothetical protein
LESYSGVRLLVFVFDLMGAAISTLANHANEVQMLSYETIMGLVLVIPFFVQYYTATLQSYSDEKQKAHKVILSRTSHRKDIRYTSLLCGTLPMPALVPSSQDSVSTAVMSNTASALRSRLSYCSIDDHKRTPQEIRFTASNIDDTPSPLGSPVRKSVIAAKHHSIMDSESMAIECDLLGIPHVKQVPPNSIAARSSLEALLEASEVRLDSKSYSIPSRSKTSPKSSTSHYLETVARKLSEKAQETKLHSDHVGIAQALLELGDILAQEEQHARALRVYQRAEMVQRMVVHETLVAVTSALRQKAKYHAGQPGHEWLAAKYRSLADELKAHPTPQNLTNALVVRQEERDDDDELKEKKPIILQQYVSPKEEMINLKLDRRLKRASLEAVPLVRALKEQANCSSAIRKKKSLKTL